MNNAYLYSQMDVPVIMEQPNNSAGMRPEPNKVCMLMMSLYGARPVEELWDSLIDSEVQG